MNKYWNVKNIFVIGFIVIAISVLVVIVCKEDKKVN